MSSPRGASHRVFKPHPVPRLRLLSSPVVRCPSRRMEWMSVLLPFIWDLELGTWDVGLGGWKLAQYSHELAFTRPFLVASRNLAFNQLAGSITSGIAALSTLTGL